MRQRTLLAIIVAAVAATGWLVLPALTSSGAREPLPPAYAGRANPRALDPDAASAGAALFATNCAVCHGAGADGHGPAAGGLAPPPADFRASEFQRHRTDAEIFYRLSEGKPGTAMPAFRAVLDEDERWALVVYLRTLGGPPLGAR